MVTPPAVGSTRVALSERETKDSRVEDTRGPARDVKPCSCVIHAHRTSPTARKVRENQTSRPADTRVTRWVLVNLTLLAADQCLIDVRFRCACFLQALAHLSHTAFIMIHDYNDRLHYDGVKRFCRRVASVDTLVIFQAKSASDV